MTTPTLGSRSTNTTTGGFGPHFLEEEHNGTRFDSSLPFRRGVCRLCLGGRPMYALIHHGMTGTVEVYHSRSYRSVFRMCRAWREAGKTVSTVYMEDAA